MVNQRAIVGIVITALFHEHRIMMYPEARAKLSLLNEDADFIKNLHTIQIQLQLSRETQKIDRKMREEIIPEMMRNPRIGNANKIGFDETEDSDDLNPEWENWIDKSGITDKLREMGELQMEGADVYMSTFSQLKQFPFSAKCHIGSILSTANFPILLPYLEIMKKRECPYWTLYSIAIPSAIQINILSVSA